MADYANGITQNDLVQYALTNKTETGKALTSYDKSLFWEYGESEIPRLGPELVIPRVTRYGTLEEIIRLFVIFPTDVIREVVKNDRELDRVEKTLLNFFCEHGESL